MWLSWVILSSLSLEPPWTIPGFTIAAVRKSSLPFKDIDWNARRSLLYFPTSLNINICKCFELWHIAIIAALTKKTTENASVTQIPCLDNIISPNPNQDSSFDDACSDVLVLTCSAFAGRSIKYDPSLYSSPQWSLAADGDSDSDMMTTWWSWTSKCSR